ncbi:MAG: hypothetical protein HZB41_00280 [Ignavibacteriae bacterium]|nr:hypothetical protein [Ignavibacteriota bacterium]
MSIVKIIFVLFFAILFIGLNSCSDKKKLSNDYFTLPRVEFKTGETIHLIFHAPEGLKTNAWIGIIPSNVKHGSEAENDQYDVTYQYLYGKTKSTMMFTAPAQPGNYDFRLNSTDENGVELGSISFVVK